MKRLIIAGIICTGVLVLAACAARTADEATEAMADMWVADIDMPAPPAIPESLAFTGYDAPVATPLPSPAEAASPARMMIQRAYVNMESDDVEQASRDLRDVALYFGGHIEQSRLTVFRETTQFDITMRVPVAYFDDALHRVKDLGHVASLNQSAADVTAQFYDMSGRLETRLIEEERVLSLIEEAEYVWDLLALEQRLGQIRTNIELYRSRLANLENQAAMSTITVFLRQTQEEGIVVATGFGGRLSNAFGDSANFIVTVFQGFVVFFAGAIIPLVAIAVLALTAMKVTTIVIKRRRSAQF